MGVNINFGYGLRRLIDLQQRFIRAGNPVYFRVRDFGDIQEESFTQLGFSASPSGSVATGTTDVLVDPPPAVTWVSTHNIGQSMGKLRFGARVFLISHTFVLQQCALMGITDAMRLWQSPFAVGLYTDSLLFSIESVETEQLAGATITWVLTCNSNEVR